MVGRGENSILTFMTKFQLKINVAICKEPQNGVKLFENRFLVSVVSPANFVSPLCGLFPTKKFVNNIFLPAYLFL